MSWRSCSSSASLRRRGGVQLEVQAWTEPHQISPETPLIYGSRTTARKAGFRPEVFGWAAARSPRRSTWRGSRQGWGPGDDEAFHITDEYVDVRQLLAFCRLTCLVTLDLLA
jgi:acetylornithine deacetylase/succinyl-diaminopimelate desuccinylase-like protein